MNNNVGIEQLAGFLRGHRRVVALTGAGCSTASGIPDYRDADGSWKHTRPVLYPDFVRSAPVRRRYWARSSLGWPHFAAARPNPAHTALAVLAETGLVAGVITQNVDRLHHQAGNRGVIELHGRLDRVRCLGCEARLPRADWQAELLAANPGWADTPARAGPDGDAAPLVDGYGDFQVPPCRLCGGLLKPDVVFYGEAIPVGVTAAALSLVEAADALLIIGSSLMVYSGFRLVREAATAGKAIATINLGCTRADPLIGLRWTADCALALPALAGHLVGNAGALPTRNGPSSEPQGTGA